MSIGWNLNRSSNRQDSFGSFAKAPLKEVPSLQHLSATCIWEQKEKFDHPDLDVNIFLCIPKSLRSYLVDEFAPFITKGNHYLENEAMFRLLTRLLSDNLTELVLPIKNLKMDKEISCKLWSNLLEKCPNLQRVDTGYSFDNWDPCIDMLFKKMYPHLQVVELNGARCVLKDENLCAIAQNMPNLRVLDVSKLDGSVSEKGFKALATLQHLEKFIFFDYQQLNDFMLLCFLYLPKLRFAGNRYSEKLKRKWLEPLSKPWALGLQEVTLDETRSLPDGILLPNLTTLRLHYPLDDFQFDTCDQRLSKVSELNLYNFYKYMDLLGHLGRQLKKLSIEVEQSTPLGQIFNLCPNLEFFSYRQDFSSTPSDSPIKLDTLQKLTELKFCAGDWIWGTGPEVVQAYSGVLLQLLQAPELRKLELGWFLVEESEMDEIVRRLQQREILQKLQKVNISPLDEDDEDQEPWNPNEWIGYDHIELLLKEINLYCPNLHRD